jgi:hypothetical protein
MKPSEILPFRGSLLAALLTLATWPARAEAPTIRLRDWAAPVPSGWHLVHVTQVADEPRVEGFTQKSYEGDVWVLRDGPNPRDLLLIRSEFDDGSLCSGTGMALGLGGTLDFQLDLIMPVRGCDFDLGLPGDKVQYVRVRSWSGGQAFVARCFGAASDAAPLQAACNAVTEAFDASAHP